MKCVWIAAVLAVKLCNAVEFAFCHFSDIHSAWHPVEKETPGLAALHGTIQDLCPADRLITFGGDFLDHVDRRLYSLETQFLDALNVDVFTFGNHEFDDGDEIVNAFSNSDHIKHPLPVLTNLVGPLMDQQRIPSYVLHFTKPDNIPICIFGFAPLDTTETSAPSTAAIFMPYKAALRAAIIQCEAEYIEKLKSNAALHADAESDNDPSNFLGNNRTCVDQSQTAESSTALPPRPLRLLLSHVGLRHDLSFYNWKEPLSVISERAARISRRKDALARAEKAVQDKLQFQHGILYLDPKNFTEPLTLANSATAFETDSDAQLLEQLTHEGYVARELLRRAIHLATIAEKAAHMEASLEMPFVDVILGAHSHTYTPQPTLIPYMEDLDSKPRYTLAMHAGSHAKALGVLKVDITFPCPSDSHTGRFGDVHVQLDDHTVWRIETEALNSNHSEVSLLSQLPVHYPSVFPAVSLDLEKARAELRAKLAEADKEKKKSRVIHEGLNKFLFYYGLPVGDHSSLLAAPRFDTEETPVQVEPPPLPPEEVPVDWLKHAGMAHSDKEVLLHTPTGLRSEDVRERSTVVGRLVGDAEAWTPVLAVGAIRERLDYFRESLSKIEVSGHADMESIRAERVDKLTKEIAERKGALLKFVSDVHQTHVGIVSLQISGTVRKPIAMGDVTRREIDNSIPFGTDGAQVWVSMSVMRLCDALDRSVAHVTWMPPNRAPLGIHRRGGFPLFGGMQVHFHTGRSEGSKVSSISFLPHNKHWNQSLRDDILGWDVGQCGVPSLENVYVCDSRGKDAQRIVNDRVLVVTSRFVASGGDGLLGGVSGDEEDRLGLCDFTPERELVRPARGGLGGGGGDMCVLEGPGDMFGSYGTQNALEMYLRWLGGKSVLYRGGSVSRPLVLADDPLPVGGDDGRYVFVPR